MAGGNRYKHRSLGGGLVPNNQQAPSNNFYVAPPPEPSMLEKALQLAQALGDASSEYTGKANADPGNRLSPFGAAPTQFIKDSAKHLWDEKFGLVPAGRAVDDTKALIDILSAERPVDDITGQRIPLTSPEFTQAWRKGESAAGNAAIAALDASTLIPGWGVVPKIGKSAGKAAAASVADDVARVKPLGYDDWSPEWRAASDKGLDMSTEARMARAREQGFNVDEPLYRGQESDFQPFGGVYASTDPDMANQYARGQGAVGYPLLARGNMKALPDTPLGSETIEGIGFDSGAQARTQIAGEGFDGASYADQRYILDPANVRSPSAAFDPDNIGKPSMLGMGFPFSGKDGEKPLLSALMDAVRGKGRFEPKPLAQMDRAEFRDYLNQLKKLPMDELKSVVRGHAGYPVKGSREQLLAEAENAFRQEEITRAKHQKIDQLTDVDWAGNPEGYKPNVPDMTPETRQQLQGILSAVREMGKAPTPTNPLDQFTPPTSIDDIFTGGSPRGAREITGGTENPAGLEGGFFNDPRFNGPQQPVPYNPESGFGGLDAKFAADKNARTLSEALAKAKREGASDNDLLALLLSYGAASGMGASLWAEQAQQSQPGM